jgi:hypothetical protein
MQALAALAAVAQATTWQLEQHLLQHCWQPGFPPLSSAPGLDTF